MGEVPEEVVTAAHDEWRGIKGAAWGERNPTSVEGTDRSWRKRFGYGKKSFIRSALSGVVPTGSTWLDVGSSGGGHMSTMRAVGQDCRFGCDLNLDSLRHLPVAAVADAQRLPYATGSFDGVTTSGTLMHVGPDQHVVDALNECARVARKYLLFVEVWQPTPMQIGFGDLMPPAWVFPWERVIPMVLSPAWTMERCRLARTCGRVPRCQPLMMVLMRREGPISENGIYGEVPIE